MGLVRTAAASAALCFVLSACNTTDALTPQVDIGDGTGSVSSSPVTQSDTMRMAAASVQPVYGSETQDSYRSGYSQQAYQAPPSSTLDGQADALRSGGSNPAASRPLADDPQQFSARSDNRGYSDTTQSEQAEADRRLNDQPMQNQADDQQQGDQQQDAQQPPLQQQASIAPSAGADDGSVRFLPIIGAPVQAVTPLSRQLGSEARSHGLTIKGSTDNTSSYILKGYLSAFQDGPSITVSYVWDVLDNSGARLHRIQGTESVPMKGGDPWTAVPPSTMQQIASKTMSEFASWRSSRGG